VDLVCVLLRRFSVTLNSPSYYPSRAGGYTTPWENRQPPASHPASQAMGAGLVSQGCRCDPNAYYVLDPEPGKVYPLFQGHDQKYLKS
jgi:hypothetical protein